ncbi:hypothetical protein [Halomonas sp.]
MPISVTLKPTLLPRGMGLWWLDIVVFPRSGVVMLGSRPAASAG